MRISPSNLRLRLKDSPASTTPTSAEVEAGNARQDLLNLVKGHGCVECCGHLAMSAPSGEHVECALLRDYADRFNKEEQKVFAGCKIPKLYQDVKTGAVTALKVADVRACCPVRE